MTDLTASSDRRAMPRSQPDQRQAAREIDFLDVKFHPLSIGATAQRCADVGLAPFRYVVTPNVDHVVNIHKHPGDFKALWDSAWLSVCDSRILQMLAGFSGIDMPVVPGSDLTAYLFDHHITPETPVNVIGGNTEVIKAIKARYGLHDVRVHMPPMGLRTNVDARHECAAFAAANPAPFTFICVGSPQGEMVAKAILDRGDAAGVGLCVGASLDFLAGKETRAPKWMQNARLEWLYRLMQNPKRMYKRYLVEGPKILGIYRAWKKASKA